VAVRRWRARRGAAAERKLRRRVRELERALGRKTYEFEVAGEALRGWEVRHEALLGRAGCETPTLGGRSRLVRLRAA
jgi:hypothetical protein